MPNDNRYSMRNTVVGRFPDSRKQKRHKVQLSESIIQDIIKGTYLRDTFVEDAFMKFGKGRDRSLTLDGLKDAFEYYGIKLDSKEAADTYSRLLDKEKDLTATLIDLAIEDNAKRGIEEIQKMILEMVNRGTKTQSENPIKEIFLKFDSEYKDSVTFVQFQKCIENYVPKIKTSDAMFLAKRYCIRDDDTVIYKIMLDEIDMLDRGLNPLITWAEDLADTIVKAITARGTDFEAIFQKYAPGRKYISEKEFIDSMVDIGVASRYDTTKIQKFYYFIDDDKSQKVEFREMESIIKTHCTKTPQKLMDEILEEVKLQMDKKKYKIKDIYQALDSYSRDGLIDNKSFRKALTKDLKFHIDEIDLDFACQIYKDKIDKRSVRYSIFIDDIKQKFQLTETYVVPGEIRKEPSYGDNPLSKNYGRKDFATPKKSQDDIKKLLKELKYEAQDKKVDLDRAFKLKRFDLHLTENEFKDVLYDNNIRLEHRDIQKLVDRYINTVINTIDCSALLEQMHNGGESHRDISSSKDIRNIINKDIMTKIAKKLHTKKICEKVIENMERQDEYKKFYLSFEDIKHSFHRANFKLSTVQVQEMLEDIKQNKDKEYNYHILLCSLFGTNYKREIRVEGKPVIMRSKFAKIKNGSRRDSIDGSVSEDSKESRHHHSRSRRRSSKDSDRRSDYHSKTRDRSERRDGHSSRRLDSKSKTREERSRAKDSRSKSRPHDSKSRDRGGRSGRESKSRGDRSRGERLGDSRSKVRDERSRQKDRGSRSRAKDDRSKSRPARDRGRDTREKISATRPKHSSKSRTPLGKCAINIGKKLENSRYDYIEHIKHFAGDDKEYILTDDQVWKILDGARIRTTKTEREDFVRDMNDTRFTVEEFLTVCNLNTSAFGDGVINQEIILSPDEKEHARKQLIKIGEAIDSEKKEFERVFNIGPYDKKVEFSEFRYGIENDINDSTTKISGDMRSISLLKNYLVENINKDEMIDVKFLINNMFPSGDDKPEVKTKMNCVTDFINFLKESPDIDIEREFKGSISHEEFEKRLDDLGFEMSKENVDKLKDAFTNSKDPGVISLNLIKRNINMLSPDILNKGKATTKKEVIDRLAHVDKDVKNTLVKISEFLKRERMDTMTFFEKCDVDGDGELKADEF